MGTRSRPRKQGRCAHDPLLEFTFRENCISQPLDTLRYYRFSNAKRLNIPFKETFYQAIHPIFGFSEWLQQIAIDLRKKQLQGGR